MPSRQFLNLTKEKQEQIIYASLSEFAEYGYDLASTNRIVQQADISKGALFKYFNGKEALFLYVFESCIQSYFDTIPRELAGDLFEWVQKTTLHKLRFMRERPLTYQLLVRVMKDPRHPVNSKAINSQFVLLNQFTDELKSILPTDKLRPGLTWEHVFDFMTWIGLGLQEKFMTSIPDIVDESFEQTYQAMVDEWNVYFEILKFGIYKED